ncbi:MAG TPA: hypothetical protein VHI93_05515 [Candidatus Thermoplasmatota archaeon]|nr:hypothetical protein [Candidatus Thermoplasmatota archaeon]
MTPIPRTKTLLTILAFGLLAVGAAATSVAAKPGDGREAAKDGRETDREAAKHDREMEREAAKHQREVQREQRKELRDEVKEACKAAKDNASQAGRCEHLKDAVKARRVAHALLTAIRVHERELGRVTFRIHEVEQQLNGTGLNATARQSLETRLANLEERQERLIEKIADERAKLQRLHDKWAEVADHVRDRREKGEDGDEDGAATSTTTTAAA